MDLKMRNKEKKPRWERRADYRKKRIFGREQKAQFTKGNVSSGFRISFAQYDLLVRLGLDGDKIKGWTAARASQEIEKQISQAGKP